MTKHNEGLSAGLTGVSTSRGRGVDGFSRVGHLGDVAVDVVGGVGDGLETAVGEVHLRRTKQILFSRIVFHICAQTPKSNYLPLLFG